MDHILKSGFSKAEKTNCKEAVSYTPGKAFLSGKGPGTQVSDTFLMCPKESSQVPLATSCPTLQHRPPYYPFAPSSQPHPLIYSQIGSQGLEGTKENGQPITTHE